MEEFDDEVEAVHQSVLKRRELGMVTCVQKNIYFITENIYTHTGTLKKPASSRKKHSSSPLYSLPLFQVINFVLFEQTLNFSTSPSSFNLDCTFPIILTFKYRTT